MQNSPASTIEEEPAAEGATRRQWLQWLVGGVLGMIGVILARVGERFLTPPLITPQSIPAIVRRSDAPGIGGAIYVAAVRAYLMQDTQGYFALSAICTHLGCLVDVSGDGLQCPCHGSRYDREGRNLSAPAPRPLDHLAISRDSRGDLVIDPNMVVDPTTRLLVDG